MENESKDRPDEQPQSGLTRHLLNLAGSAGGVSGRQTTSLVGRISRQIERSQVWHPDPGSLSPKMVADFTGSIRERFPSYERKYAIESPNPEQGEGDELVLPPISPVFTPVARSAKVNRQPAPGPLPSDLLLREHSQPAESPSTSSTTLLPTPPPVQRKPGIRPVSSLQMVTTAGVETRAAAAAPPERASAPSTPPTIQRSEPTGARPESTPPALTPAGQPRQEPAGPSTAPMRPLSSQPQTAQLSPAAPAQTANSPEPSTPLQRETLSGDSGPRFDLPLPNVGAASLPPEVESTALSPAVSRADHPSPDQAVRRTPLPPASPGQLPVLHPAARVEPVPSRAASLQPGPAPHSLPTAGSQPGPASEIQRAAAVEGPAETVIQPAAPGESGLISPSSMPSQRSSTPGASEVTAPPLMRKPLDALQPEQSASLPLALHSEVQRAASDPALATHPAQNLPPASPTERSPIPESIQRESGPSQAVRTARFESQTPAAGLELAHPTSEANLQTPVPAEAPRSSPGLSSPQPTSTHPTIPLESAGSATSPANLPLARLSDPLPIQRSSQDPAGEAPLPLLPSRPAAPTISQAASQSSQAAPTISQAASQSSQAAPTISQPASQSSQAAPTISQPASQSSQAAPTISQPASQSSPAAPTISQPASLPGPDFPLSTPRPAASLQRQVDAGSNAPNTQADSTAGKPDPTAILRPTAIAPFETPPPPTAPSLQRQVDAGSNAPNTQTDSAAGKIDLAATLRPTAIAPSEAPPPPAGETPLHQSSLAYSNTMPLAAESSAGFEPERPPAPSLQRQADIPASQPGEPASPAPLAPGRSQGIQPLAADTRSTRDGPSPATLPGQDQGPLPLVHAPARQPESAAIQPETDPGQNLVRRSPDNNLTALPSALPTPEQVKGTPRTESSQGPGLPSPQSPPVQHAGNTPTQPEPSPMPLVQRTSLESQPVPEAQSPSHNPDLRPASEPVPSGEKLESPSSSQNRTIGEISPRLQRMPIRREAEDLSSATSAVPSASGRSEWPLAPRPEPELAPPTRTIGSSARGMAEQKANQFAQRETRFPAPNSPAILPQARNWTQPASEETDTRPGQQAMAEATPLAYGPAPTPAFSSLPLVDVQRREALPSKVPTPPRPVAHPQAAAPVLSSPQGDARVMRSTADESAPEEAPDQFVPLIQRVQDTVDPSREGQEPDLADLARKIYPIIKQMLTVERERYSSR